MNIFYLSSSPIQAARQHNLVHVNKMLQEYAQLCSTAHRLLDGESCVMPYVNYKGTVVEGEWYLMAHDVVEDGVVVRNPMCKHTHANHPSAKWVRESSQHYNWVVTCGLELCRIWREHKGEDHSYFKRYHYLASSPVNLQDNGFTEPPFCGDDDLGHLPVTTAYQHQMRRKFIDWLSRDRVGQVKFLLPRPQWLSVYS